jgi:hypothetical protein
VGFVFVAACKAFTWLHLQCSTKISPYATLIAMHRGVAKSTSALHGGDIERKTTESQGTHNAKNNHDSYACKHKVATEA